MPTVSRLVRIQKTVRVKVISNSRFYTFDYFGNKRQVRDRISFRGWWQTNPDNLIPVTETHKFYMVLRLQPGCLNNDFSLWLHCQVFGGFLATVNCN